MHEHNLPKDIVQKQHSITLARKHMNQNLKRKKKHQVYIER